MQRVVSSRPVSADENPFPNDPPPNTSVRNNLPPPEPPQTKSKSDTELIVTALTQAYATVGQGVFLFINQTDGRLIVSEAEDLAESWRNLLDNDPKLRRIMKGMIKGGGWGTVITAHLAVATAIVSNHPGTMEHLFKRKNADAESDTSESPSY